MMLALSDEEANELTDLLPPVLKQWLRVTHRELYDAIEAKRRDRIEASLEIVINLNSLSLLHNCGSISDGNNEKSIVTSQMIITLLDSERIHYLDDIRRNASRLAVQTHKTNSQCHIIKCAVNGYQLYGCIDTGAQYSLLSTESMANCELSHLLDNRYNGQVIGCGVKTNTGNAILGKIHLTNIEIDCRYYFPISLLVVERLRPNLFLIGNDFLVANKCVIDCSERKIYFKTIGKTVGCVGDNKSAQLTHDVISPICQLKLMFKSLVSRRRTVKKFSK